MSDDAEKFFYTVDHANKLRERRADFDSYRFWLQQKRHREEIEARGQAGCERHAAIKSKQLT